MRRQVRSGGRRRASGPIRVGLLSRAFELIGEERVPKPRGRSCSCDFGMQGATPVRRNRVVDGLPDECVTEVEAHAVRPREDESALRQLEQRSIHRIRRFGGDRRQEVEVEGSADHGRGRGDQPGSRCQRLHSREHGLGDRVRDAGVGSPDDEFLDVQRDAVAALEQCVGERRGGQVADDRGRHPGRANRIQALQAHLLREPLADESRPPPPERGSRIQLVAAVAPHEQQGCRACRDRESSQHLQAQLVHPVKVLDSQEHRCAFVDEVEEDLAEFGNEHPVRCRSGVPDLVECFSQPGRESGGTGSAQRRDQVEEHSARRLRVAGEGGGRKHPGPTADLLLELAEQSRLADARLPGKQQQLAGALFCTAPPPHREREQLIPPDQDRAEPRGSSRRRVLREHADILGARRSRDGRTFWAASSVG